MLGNLTVVESARISSITEEALEKLSFLASITPDVMAHRDELSQIVGDEITRIIQEQRGLELRYEELIAQRASLKALSNKVWLPHVLSRWHSPPKACLLALPGQIQREPGAYQGGGPCATRVHQGAVPQPQGGHPSPFFYSSCMWHPAHDVLCCATQGNPNIAENLSKIQMERSNLQNLLSKTLRELRENSFSTLTTTVEVGPPPPSLLLPPLIGRVPPPRVAAMQEEKARNDMILEVIAKEKEVSAAVKKLQQDLTNERHQHEAEVEDRNEVRRNRSHGPGPGPGPFLAPASAPPPTAAPPPATTPNPTPTLNEQGWGV